MGGWDGAAAGVFQIITSGCGGGGSPWQPQCLQHPTTEGNRATERGAELGSLLLRTSESGCAATRTGRFPRRSAEHALAPPLMELNKQPRIDNPRMYLLRFFLRIASLPSHKIPPLIIISFRGNICDLAQRYFLFN